MAFKIGSCAERSLTLMRKGFIIESILNNIFLSIKCKYLAYMKLFLSQFLCRPPQFLGGPPQFGGASLKSGGAQKKILALCAKKCNLGPPSF